MRLKVAPRETSGNETEGLDMSFGTESPGKLPTLSLSSDSSPMIYRTAGLWQRAFTKLRTRRALARIQEDVITFGTSELLADDARYKDNLDDLLEAKIGKNEAFRRYAAEEKAEEPSAWLMSPVSGFKRLWDMWILVLLGYTAMILPFRLAFQTQTYWDTWSCVEMMADVSFLVDVLCTCCSGYYDEEGELVCSQRRVLAHYARGWLAVDMVSALPFTMFDYYLSTYQSSQVQLWLPRLYKFLRLVRLSRITRVSHFSVLAYVQEWLCGNYRLAKLTTFFLIVSLGVHIMACFWFSTWELTGHSTDSWVVRTDLSDSNKWSQYLASVYWAVTTVVTVGYGDISARSTLELTVSIGWMLVGVGFYSFTIGSLSNYLTIVDTRESILTAKLAAVQELALETGLSHPMKSKLRAAVRYSALHSGAVWRDRQHLLTSLPLRLQSHLASSVFNRILTEFPCFSSSNPSFLIHFLPLFKPIHISHSEIVYKTGDYPEEVLFVVKGRVVLVILPQDLAYKMYVKKAFFGEVEVLMGINRLENVKTVTECEFLTVKKKDFLRVLEDFPVESRKIHRIAEEKVKRNRGAMQKAYTLLRKKLGDRQASDLQSKEPLLTCPSRDFPSYYDSISLRLTTIHSKAQALTPILNDLQLILQDLTTFCKSKPY